MPSRLLALVVFAGLCTSAAAQHGPPVPRTPDEEGGAPAASRPRPEASLFLGLQHDFASEFDDAAGDVAITRVGAGLDVSIPLDDRQRFVVAFFNEFSNYEFDDATAIAGTTGEPWDDVLEHYLGVTYRSRVSDHWGVFAGASVDASYQTSADFGDSTTFGGQVGGTYSPNDKVTLGLGILVSTRLEDDVFVIPFPVVNWTISDRWSFHTGRSHGRGLRAEVAFTPIEPLTLALGAGVEAREFRLEDTGPIPDGVVRDWRVPVSLVAKWSFSKQVSVQAEVGADVFTNYTVDDSAGNELDDVDGNAAVFAGIGATFNF
ncbi:hypothetical protein PHYC_00956 [Phycisphaerales bacterium]|nr:hypothetical protein PHYC_00956 [Phycisphaerales bacterium]